MAGKVGLGFLEILAANEHVFFVVSIRAYRPAAPNPVHTPSRSIAATLLIVDEGTAHSEKSPRVGHAPAAGITISRTCGNSVLSIVINQTRPGSLEHGDFKRQWAMDSSTALYYTEKNEN